jgi:hypothetical protein
MKEVALYRTVRSARLGRGFGHVRQTTKLMNLVMVNYKCPCGKSATIRFEFQSGLQAKYKARDKIYGCMLKV